MAKAKVASKLCAEGEETALKNEGNEFFKAGKYLKAAALYTKAINLNPSNPVLYSNRAAAFLHLSKLNKALEDAENVISLDPNWEKGYLRKGYVLEAMGKHDDALSCFETALQCNPQNAESSKKIRMLSQQMKTARVAREVEFMKSHVDVAKPLEEFKSELASKVHSDRPRDAMYSFVICTLENAIKSWNETSYVDPRVHFLFEQAPSDKFPPAVAVDKAFESPHTHESCYTFLRQYADDSSSAAACLVVSKSTISYPQVWKGIGLRKWKHGMHDGFFVQFESPGLRNLWFIPSVTEHGHTLCRDPESADINSHQLLPRLFKEKLSA